MNKNSPLTLADWEKDAFNEFIVNQQQHKIHKPTHYAETLQCFCKYQDELEEFRIYSAASVPPLASTPQVDWRLGAWSAKADAMVALAVRVHRFNFDAAATELRAQLRDEVRRAGGTEDLGWAPRPALVTTDQVRLRWAVIDRRLCESGMV